MRTTTAISFMALGLLALSSVRASVISTRATAPVKANCTVKTTGYLVLVPYEYDDEDSINISFAGLNKSVTLVGADGQNDTLVITVEESGKIVDGPKFEYAVCNSTSTPPKGFKLPTGFENVTYSYGVVRPAGATKHQLGLSNRDFGTKGSRTSIVDLHVGQAEPIFSSWLAASFNWNSAEEAQLLYLAGWPTAKAVIGDDKNKRLRYYAPSSYIPSTRVQLLLVPEYEDEEEEEDW